MWAGAQLLFPGALHTLHVHLVQVSVPYILVIVVLAAWPMVMNTVGEGGGALGATAEVYFAITISAFKVIAILIALLQKNKARGAHQCFLHLVVLFQIRLSSAYV